MAELTDAEILGLKIMALFNSDMVAGLQCMNCQRQEMMNCFIDDSITSPVFSSPEFDFELTACPLRAVPDTIIQFLDSYYFHENYGASIGSYDDLNHRWHTASVLYRGYINKLLSIKTSPKKKQTNGLNVRKKYME